MKLNDTLRRRLACWAERRMKRTPSKVIGTHYLKRWHIIPRNPLANVYLHEFTGSDDDRALHDHPWVSCSIILHGWYLEHVPQDNANPAGATTAVFRDAGDITTRSSRAAHRIELLRPRAVTLFITGPKLRHWGFWCARGWRHWRVFTDPADSGQTGRGCD